MVSQDVDEFVWLAKEQGFVGLWRLSHGAMLAMKPILCI